MLEELKSQGGLYQDVAAEEILDRFGEQFVPFNESGNLSIARSVLKAFRELTEKTVVWVKGDRMWRLREEGDEAGRTDET